MAQFPDTCRFIGGTLACCGRASPPAGDLRGLQGEMGCGGACVCVSVLFFFSFFFRFRSSRHQRDGARRSGVNWCGGFTLVTSRDASKQTDVSGRNACRTLRGACNNVWALCCELYDSGSRSRGRKVPRYRQRTSAPPPQPPPPPTPPLK